MLKKVLWLALACAVLLAALALSRGVKFDGKTASEPKAVAVEVVPEAAAPPAPKVVEAPPQPTPEELQMQEDAAATGATQVDPSPESPETQSDEPPTN